MADKQRESEQITVSMPEDMVNEIDGRLEYGDSRAEWIREAVRERLDVQLVN